MEKSTRISIITASYNSKETIEEAIQSVKKQNYDNLEYIVVDGGSVDGTLELINKNRSFIDKLIVGDDDGIYDAFNKGISESKGSIIGILNSDDYYNRGVLKKVSELYEKNNPEIIHGNIKVLGSGRKEYVRRPPLTKAMRFVTTPFKHPSCFVEKEVYDRVGKYRTDIKTVSDYEFMLRCIEKGVKDEYLDEVISNVRLIGETTGEEGISSNDELKRVIYQYCKSKVLSEIFIAIRKIVKYM